MTTQELKETVNQLKGYNVVDVDFENETFTEIIEKYFNRFSVYS